MKGKIMDYIFDVLNNRSVIIPFLSWFTAQSLKFIFVLINKRKVDFTRFVGSGGMPSSHTAFVVALATVIGKNAGLYSTQFGLAVSFALVVMSDAAGVRRAAGKQAEVLNKMISSHYDKEQFDTKLKELLGHTPVEVFAGALLGLFYGLVLG